MAILGVNSAGACIQIALIKKDGADFMYCQDQKMASEILLKSIDDILKRNNLDISDIDEFGVCVGPGSFTGIRIGVTTIRAFCSALGKKVIPVTNMRVLSYNVTEADKVKNKSIITISDAGNDYYYVGFFDALHNEVVEVKCFLKNELTEFLNSVKEQYSLVLENGLEERAKELGFYDKANFQATDCSDLILALKSLESRKAEKDYNEIVPLYVRKSQVELDFSRREKLGLL